VDQREFLLISQVEQAGSFMALLIAVKAPCKRETRS